MSIKSWVFSLVKKMHEKTVQKTIQDYKGLNVRKIMVDEDMNLYHVFEDGTTKCEELSTKLNHNKAYKEKHKNAIYNDMVQQYDELFGVHRECIENGKSVLVWDVQ